MPENGLTLPELPNIVNFLAEKIKNPAISNFLKTWINIIFSLIISCILISIAFIAARKKKTIPSRFQCAVETFVSGVDGFVCGILGSKGRRFTPFIGTLFIYIITMNLSSLIPFLKASTTSWSVTLALALVAFVYIQYTAFKELGVLGYIDSMMERPRGIIAFSVVIPLLMLFIHIISELVKPISLSLRLRSNVWGDDVLLAIMAGFGIGGLPLLLFNTILTIVAGIVQAVVFSLLVTIYIAMVMPEEE